MTENPALFTIQTPKKCANRMKLHKGQTTDITNTPDRDGKIHVGEMWNNLLTPLYEYEINVNRNIQKQFAFAEQQLRALNDYLDPIFILNLWIPLAGAASQKLLIQLVTAVGFINSLASVVKWSCPEYRPVWWIKENTALKKYFYLRDIKIDSISCDTNAGLPSSHAAAFTAYALIVVWHSVKTFLPFRFILFDKLLLVYATVLLMSGFVWFARLYFLYEFLHQCLLGSLIAAVSYEILKAHFSTVLLNLGKLRATMLVLAFSLMPISAYYAMLYLDEDPFWSVRMAFKWCADPLYLKHESSPVFILCRDFGYLMGVALSSPLIKSYRSSSTTNYYRRLPVIFLMELLNAAARAYTPKEYGRFIFVAYEFFRNCMHSFMLLNILPRFDK